MVKEPEKVPLTVKFSAVRVPVAVPDASSIQLINKQKVSTSGSGSIVAVGLTTDVNGKEIAFQELNIHSLIGRVI